MIHRSIDFLAVPTSTSRLLINLKPAVGNDLICRTLFVKGVRHTEAQRVVEPRCKAQAPFVGKSALCLLFFNIISAIKKVAAIK